MIRALTVILAVAGFVGCATAPGAIGTPVPTGSVRASPAVTTPAPSDDDMLVVYHKTGGIAGVNETLTVSQGGMLELVDSKGEHKIMQVDEPVIQPIRRMLEQEDFAKLEPQYQAGGADLFVYTVTANTPSGKKSVTTMDGAKAPAYLEQLIALLDQLRQQVR